MIEFEDITGIHLEISSLCNASCPYCPRTFWGYPYNDGYPEVNMTLENVKTIFDVDFLKQLTNITLNGNYGDIVMNPETPDIVEYFKEINPAIKITISTNGSARSAEFWTRLAKADAIVFFCLDGLEDTHHLYRQNTSWNTILKNAKTFIEAGGCAGWKITKFDHNQHQISECERLSKILGFKKFWLVDDGRNTMPVFNNKGKLLHTIGNYQGEKSFKILFHKKQTDSVLLEDIVVGRIPKQKVRCNTQTKQWIYIAANGDVSPCCWTGFYPKTYGSGEYHQAVNAQLSPLMSKNNALNYPLKDCIEWFPNISACWDKKTYETGRLVVCDDNCGIE